MSAIRNEEVYGFVKADGPRLVNGRGEPILLRGVGFGSWLLPEGYMWRFPEGGDRPRRIEAMIESLVGSEEANLFWSAYYDRYIAEEDVAKIAEEGFNSVRVPINARFLTGEGRGGRAEAHVDVAAGPNETKGKTSTQVEATSSTDRASHNIYPLGEDSISNRDAPDHESETRAPLELREDRLVLLDRVIGWCREHRLYVILDLHGAPGGQTGTNIDDSERDRPELFTDEIRAREAVAIWRALAERYKDEWIVAGYDLLNEPLPDWFSNYNDRVMPLYKEMIAAIREADERHMIILEGVHWSTDWSIFEHAFGDDPVDRNVLLQFHKYWNNPDTESIAKYLEFRDRWNVPIFMGEGGENNKDWYAGAFRMFDDHDISWNFWTWKKMDTTNSPCSIRKPEEWPLLVDYLQGGEKPEPTVARTILWEYLDNMALERCDYQPEVVRALMRRAPVRIPAVFYGYKGEGTSFGFGSAERPTFVNRAAAESASTAQAGVQFRVSDRTRISFAQSDRETASFAHGGGEEWTPDLWLCVEMTVGDWFVYDFERSSEGERTGEDPKLDVALRLQSIDGSGKLRLALNDGSAVILDVQERDWHTGQTVCRVAHSEGTQSLRLTCLEGKIRVMWVNIGES
ncbi:glycoside hydrolase family 5 protein [Paenibacillus sp. PAMC21692]|uniref:glycoside hydrolase family 5 protein n=1 Tax=Paenibacillus sp. PAMC21692 TaxID=2762320 RepID=UPI0021C44E21|nr:glycoside hydrolase family 5 protein [Paenibacillus sp. PAMC21692]